MPKKKLSFEKSLEQLEQVVEEMESGDVPLDKCIDLYEKGVKLANFCTKELDAAEKRIEKLNKKSDGSFDTTPFDEADDDDDSPENDTDESNVPF